MRPLKGSTQRPKKGTGSVTKNTFNALQEGVRTSAVVMYLK